MRHAELIARLLKLPVTGGDWHAVDDAIAALQAEPVPMTDQEFTAWIESSGFVIEPHTAWTVKELVERHHNIKPKGGVMKPEQVNKVIAALEAVDALISHQYTGSRDAMSALQNAADDCRECIAIMRGGAAEPEGGKRVPIEPTPEMCQAGGKAMFTASWESEDAEAADIYRAMLKAAPEAP